jgi:hypothetical protein
MSVKIIGAGFGRTGTHSLKVALERLLGGTCHHMVEVFAHPDEVAVWSAAARGDMPDWNAFLTGYSAIVDWPGAAFWPELMEAFPDAPVLLSVRSADSWWKSASNTILLAINEPPPGASDGDAAQGAAWLEMIRGMFARHGITDPLDEVAMKAAFEHNIARAREQVPADRLVEWTATDGWGPICAALDVAVPAEPFPVTNTTAEFRQMLGLET